MKSLLLLISIISLLSLSIVGSSSNNNIDVEAKKYLNYDGEKVTEKQYKARLGYCEDMKLEGEIPTTTNCDEWVLTEDGNVKITLYGFKLSRMK